VYAYACFLHAVCILKVCVCIQLGCVRRPYVCTHILVPENPNLNFLAFVSLLYLFNMSIFCHSFLYVYVSASMFFLLFVL